MLFTGDSTVCQHGKLVGSLPAFTQDRLQAVSSVHKQAALAPDVACPGHSPVVTDATNQMPAS